MITPAMREKATVILTSMFGLNLSSNTETAAAAPDPETRIATSEKMFCPMFGLVCVKLYSFSCIFVIEITD